MRRLGAVTIRSIILHWITVSPSKKILFNLRTHVKVIRVRTMATVSSCQELSTQVTVVNATVQATSGKAAMRNVPKT